MCLKSFYLFLNIVFANCKLIPYFFKFYLVDNYNSKYSQKELLSKKSGYFFLSK